MLAFYLCSPPAIYMLCFDLALHMTNKVSLNSVFFFILFHPSLYFRYFNDKEEENCYLV